MMDAGMRLFESEKPLGTVLGGIKNEMGRYGRLMRRNEIDPEELPATTGDCDLFLDRSTRFKSKYLSCRVEDAGTVGKTADGEEIHRFAASCRVEDAGTVGKTVDGEEIHRYAASLKEGNRNTNVGIYVHMALIIIWAMLGWFLSEGNAWIVLVFTAVGIFGAWRQLRPSKDNLNLANKLLDIFSEGK